MRARGANRQALIDLMDRAAVDALVYPFKSLGAPLIGDGDRDTRDNPLSSVTGLPAIVLPAGVTKAGLPIAIEMLGRPFSEPVLIRVGLRLRACRRARALRRRARRTCPARRLFTRRAVRARLQSRHSLEALMRSSRLLLDRLRDRAHRFAARRAATCRRLRRAAPPSNPRTDQFKRDVGLEVDAMRREHPEDERHGVQLRRARVPGVRDLEVPHRHPREERLHDSGRRRRHSDRVDGDAGDRASR